MIVKLNHLNGKSAGASAQVVVDTIYSLLAEGRLPREQFSRLQIELDWIQYKQNFREVVIASQGYTPRGEQLPVLDILVDTRQVNPGTLRVDMVRALARAAGPEGARNREVDPDHLVLEEFRSLRHSMVWEFNKLYWGRLNHWEAASGKGYEEALPGGQSDGHNADAIADSVADFWTLLRDLEARNQLPAEVFMLELGVGTGTRCGIWLDKFQALDRMRGTSYYPRLRMLLGDYSLATLDLSKPAVRNHADLCSFMVIDAMNPLKTLSFLRHKILLVHAANVYDNLPDEEVVRRDGRLYFVHVRSYIPRGEAERIGVVFGVAVEKLRSSIHRILEGGFDDLGSVTQGVSFWREVWKAIRLEERLVLLEDLPDFPFPEGLDATKLEDILQYAPADLRFHLSSGALESFMNTMPLLHPRGCLQVEDIFVTDLSQYRLGFYGPGKLEGSLLNWVNGALLKGVGERAGYDVHFAPFHYRKGSKTSVLYTTRRE